MTRGNTLLENISKLNTFIHMIKSNEFLSIYIEKIINNKSKSIKFINDFDYISLDLLYTSLQIMNYSDKITKETFYKIDKKELKYYMDKTKGINYFKKQVPSIKSEEILVDYLKDALANGKYICNNNNTVRFDNGLIVDSDWIVEFSNFLITSLNNNENLSNDSLTYHLNAISFPEEKSNNLKQYIKDIKLYEYNVTRKDEKKLSYQDIKYLIDTLSIIKDYDFKQLQEINSILAKEKFTLSINKKNVSFTKEEKQKIEKMLNEEHYENVLTEYIKDILKCNNSKSNLNKRKLIDNYELLRSLSHAYKCHYTLQECRKLFDLKEKKADIMNALTISNFYINYIYDEENLSKYFNYALLKLDDLKPTIIDYETTEYKNIISELSNLNKKVVVINRRINKCLDIARTIPKNNEKLKEENGKTLARNCHELEKLVKDIRTLREELNSAKDENRRESNINKTKLKYIKDSIINGKYSYDSDTSLITFDSYSPKDYHCTFHLEITIERFIEVILSDYNRNIRINFYQL